MKYVRWFARVLLLSLLWAMLAVLVNNLLDASIPLWFSMIIGSLSVIAFWED